MLRIEDLDRARCKREYVAQVLRDLEWVGIVWDNDVSDPMYHQSHRQHLYLEAWRLLYEKGYLYPSRHSRKDVERCLSAPHESEEGAEPVFPTELRPAYMQDGATVGRGNNLFLPADLRHLTSPSVQASGTANWRFRVPDGQKVEFVDGNYGPVSYTAGVDFGDFLVWRADDTASYELAVVVDNLEMGITEVVRGQDLLLSTARQLLLMDVLCQSSAAVGKRSKPAFFHCPLVLDKDGKRMAKRCASNTLQGLREAGVSPTQLSELFHLAPCQMPAQFVD